MVDLDDLVASAPYVACALTQIPPPKLYTNLTGLAGYPVNQKLLKPERLRAHSSHTSKISKRLLILARAAIKNAEEL